MAARLGAATRVSSSGLLRWILIPSAGIAFALGAMWAVSGSLAKQPPMLSAPVDDTDMVALAPDGAVIDLDSAQSNLMALRMATNEAAKADRLAPKPTLKVASPDRFDLVVKKAALSPQKLASLFAKPDKPVAKAARARPAHLSDPAPERFASTRTRASRSRWLMPIRRQSHRPERLRRCRLWRPRRKIWRC